ncbi:MAG: peroxiredoxin [Alphaproteobacteria bacterium]|nr:peroxiredoxin [Alphaproteobacteria bacterium]
MPTAAKSSRKTIKKPAKPAAKKVKTPAPAEKPAAGDRAPAFSMKATKIGSANSAALKGKLFVLYFYPKDDTSGCTAEACGFRDALPAFSKLGIAVVGVSKDSIESHEKFAKKYQLTFPLASDPEGKVCEQYGVWKKKSMYGRIYMGIERSTFLIDAKGVVRAAWRKVSVAGHVEAVKKALAEL